MRNFNTITLNLTASNNAEERIKAYLEENASSELAEKINNGTPVEKDGKTLYNRKTLTGFIKYATAEARKVAEKGAQYACIADNMVFGWAIHYFEEESIIEKLYTASGEEYKTAPTAKAPTQKPQAPQKAKILPTPVTEPKPVPKPTPVPVKKADPVPVPVPVKNVKNTQISIFDF